MKRLGLWPYSEQRHSEVRSAVFENWSSEYLMPEECPDDRDSSLDHARELGRYSHFVRIWSEF